jgi:hypothetical protein
MQTQSEYPFTAEEFTALNERQQQAVLAVTEYLNDRRPQITDEGLSRALNVLKEAEGCVPFEEVDNDLLLAVRRKFAAVYQTAVEMAEAELRQQGFKERQHFNFCLVIEPSSDDATHIAVIDYQKPICYLHEWSKAWHFTFKDLADLAEFVLRVKANLVDRVVEFNKPPLAVR